MFDNLSIEYPLPFNSYLNDKVRQYISATLNEDGLQTKDLQNTLSNYHISNDGRLFQVIHSSFDEVNQSTPIYNQKYHHGHIRAYTMVFLDDEKQNILWVEYDLKFTDGLLVSATMIRPTKEESDGLH